jgi:hypothetical protein
MKTPAVKVSGRSLFLILIYFDHKLSMAFLESTGVKGVGTSVGIHLPTTMPQLAIWNGKASTSNLERQGQYFIDD